MADQQRCDLAGCPAKKKAIFSLTAYFICLFLLLATAFIFIWITLNTAMHKAGATTLMNNVVATIGTQSSFSATVITPPKKTGNSETVISIKNKASNNKAIIVIPDVFAILIVAACGSFGGLIHAIRSFYFHVKAGDLVQSDLIKLILRPFSGATLALIFYLVLRAGLGQVTPSDISEGASIMFYAAVGALVGMFTDQTVAKLKKVAEAILTKPDEKK